MMNANPGSGVVTNNIANTIAEDRARKCCSPRGTTSTSRCTGAQRWTRRWPRGRSSSTCDQPVEMTQFADIVLPATFNSAEGWSIVTNAGNGRLRLDPAGRG